MNQGLGVDLQKVTCRYHPDAILIDDYHAGDVICSECGLVVQDRVIDVSSEWRTFGDTGDKNNKDNSRVGAAENLLLDNDLTTSIKFSRDDPDSVSLKNSQRNLTSKNRSLTEAFSEIKQVSERLLVPKGIQDEAKHMYKLAYENKLIKGKSRTAVSAACIYLACLHAGVSRSYKEICGATTVAVKYIQRACKAMTKSLNLNIEAPSTIQYTSRYCNRLSLPSNVTNMVEQIIRRIDQQQFLEGRSPVSKIAVAIYMACQHFGMSTTSKEISEATGAADSTIHTVYEIVRSHEQRLLAPDGNSSK